MEVGLFGLGGFRGYRGLWGFRVSGEKLGVVGGPEKMRVNLRPL